MDVIGSLQRNVTVIQAKLNDGIEVDTELLSQEFESLFTELRAECDERSELWETGLWVFSGAGLSSRLPVVAQISRSSCGANKSPCHKSDSSFMQASSITVVCDLSHTEQMYSFKDKHKPRTTPEAVPLVWAHKGKC